MHSRQFKEKYQQYTGQLNSYKKLLEDEEKNNNKLSQDYIDAEKASDILQLVGMQTQDNLRFRIENLVTAGLEFVFDDPYQFKVEFDISRGNSQCNLFFERDGMVIDPIKDGSGGALDVASLSLRLATWSLQLDRSSPVFILDECFKHVSRDLRERATLFLKEMCTKLGIQVIAVSHSDELEEGSDNLIKIVMKDGISQIEREK